MSRCRYCNFSHQECVLAGEDICPLTKTDDQLAECWDVNCEYYENCCDYCLSYKEGAYEDD